MSNLFDGPKAKHLIFNDTVLAGSEAKPFVTQNSLQHRAISRLKDQFSGLDVEPSRMHSGTVLSKTPRTSSRLKCSVSAPKQPQITKSPGCHPTRPRRPVRRHNRDVPITLCARNIPDRGNLITGLINAGFDLPPGSYTTEVSWAIGMDDGDVLDITFVSGRHAKHAAYALGRIGVLLPKLSPQRKMYIESTKTQGNPKELWGRDSKAQLPDPQVIRNCVLNAFGLPVESPPKFPNGEPATLRLSPEPNSGATHKFPETSLKNLDKVIKANKGATRIPFGANQGISRTSSHPNHGVTQTFSKVTQVSPEKSFEPNHRELRASTKAYLEAAHISPGRDKGATPNGSPAGYEGRHTVAVFDQDSPSSILSTDLEAPDFVWVNPWEECDRRTLEDKLEDEATTSRKRAREADMPEETICKRLKSAGWEE